MNDPETRNPRVTVQRVIWFVGAVVLVALCVLSHTPFWQHLVIYAVWSITVRYVTGPWVRAGEP